MANLPDLTEVVRSLNIDERFAREAGQLFLEMPLPLKRGVRNAVLMIGCLYSVLKTASSCPPVSLHRLLDAVPSDIYPRIKFKEVARCYRRLMDAELLKPQVCTIRPTIYVRSIAEKLGFDDSLILITIEAAKQTVRRGLHVGRSPMVVAASVIYLIDLENALIEQKKFSLESPRFRITMNEVADAAFTIDSSIMKTVHYLAPRMTDVFPLASELVKRRRTRLIIATKEKVI